MGHGIRLKKTVRLASPRGQNSVLAFKLSDGSSLVGRKSLKFKIF